MIWDLSNINSFLLGSHKYRNLGPDFTDILLRLFCCQREVQCQWLSCIRFFATPWIAAHQAPLSMKFSRQEYWSGLLFPSPGDLPDPGIEHGSSTLQADYLPSGKPLVSEGNQTQNTPRNMCPHLSSDACYDSKISAFHPALKDIYTVADARSLYRRDSGTVTCLQGRAGDKLS